TTFVFDDVRRLTSITRPNGVVSQYTYDKNNRIATITETDGGGNVLGSIALQRDAAGKTVSATRTLPTDPAPAPGILPVAYDAAHQVAGATYDAMGRLTADSL